MKPAFYLRVSTRSQEFPSQLHALKEYCRRQGFPLPKASSAGNGAASSRANLFAEKESGAKAKRRALDELLQACREGKFDTIITYRGDRLGRSFEHMVQLYAELREIKIRVLGVVDMLDTAGDSAATRAFQRMLATTAEMQREMIVENTRAGIAAARKAGRIGGRPRADASQVAKARKLHSQGKTLRQIAQKTGQSLGWVAGAVK